ncbi:MAG: hypothetical protein K2X82_04590 [Gemmataceae bacterium]|nr:hypothetical protein [Gemmataceae bacterium]
MYGRVGPAFRRFRFDTGCNVTTVSEDVAAGLGLPPGGRTVTVGGSTGRATGRLVPVRFRFPTSPSGPGLVVDSTWVVTSGRRNVALLGFQEVHRHFWVRTEQFEMWFVPWPAGRSPAAGTGPPVPGLIGCDPPFSSAGPVGDVLGGFTPETAAPATRPDLARKDPDRTGRNHQSPGRGHEQGDRPPVRTEPRAIRQAFALDHPQFAVLDPKGGTVRHPYLGEVGGRREPLGVAAGFLVQEAEPRAAQPDDPEVEVQDCPAQPHRVNPHGPLGRHPHRLAPPAA